MNTREIASEYRLVHWAEIMQNRKDSGLSIKRFCENTGIHANTYYYWQRKLREAACGDLNGMGRASAGLMPAVFAEVKLAASAGLPPTGTRNHSICVEISGARITADSGYPAEKLAYLTRAVMQSC